MMKILLLCPGPFFAFSGLALNVRRRAHALVAAGHQVDLLCDPGGEPVELAGLRVLPPRSRTASRAQRASGAPGLMMLARAIRLTLRGKYDVLHAVNQTIFGARWLARLRRLPLVYDMNYSFHEELPEAWCRWSPLGRLLGRWEAAALREAALVITAHQDLTALAGRQADPGRVFQIEDAPLADSFREDPDGARRLAGELDLRGPCILYTGNFDKSQGLDLLLKAARLVLQKTPDVRFVLVGGAGSDIRRLQKIAHSLGIAPACQFTGWRAPEEIPAFLTLAHVLVSPRTGGIHTAVKLATYMQSGRPIVATRLPTHTRLLDEECARLVLPTAEDLAAGLLHVLSEPLLTRALTREARSRAIQRHGIPRFNHQLRAAYARLTAPPAIP